jgi:hypothetical protein
MARRFHHLRPGQRMLARRLGEENRNPLRHRDANGQALAALYFAEKPANLLEA